MTGIDFYGDLTGTGRILRMHPVEENTRGPDSVECRPWSGTHQACWYNYLTFGPVHGFLCGCVCHDREPTDSGKES